MTGFLLFGFSLPISIIDIKTYRIPDVLSLGGLLAISIWRFYLDGWIWKGLNGQLFIGLLGASIGFMVMGLVFLSSRGRLGFGDVKLSAFHGAILGIPGWFWGLLTASLAGLFFGILFRNRWDKERPIPFAPFLSFGAMVAWLFIVSTGTFFGVIR